MDILTIGSLNIDHVYRVPRLVRPGETLAASDYRVFAGGKGFNQSVALARAGAAVRHAGCVGADGVWLLDRLRKEGVETSGVEKVGAPTGHAVIQVDDEGENAILLFGGANREVRPDQIRRAVNTMPADGLLLLQNEISHVADAIRPSAFDAAQWPDVPFRDGSPGECGCGRGLDRDEEEHVHL